MMILQQSLTRALVLFLAFVALPARPAQASCVAGSLSGSVVTYTTNQSINLTSLGTTDWAAFGYDTNAASIQRDSAGGSQISALSQVGSVALANWNGTPDVPAFLSSWTNGSPDTPISGEGWTVYSGGMSVTGAGMSFTVPADTTTRTLTVYVAISPSPSNGKLIATLSDGSATQYVDTSVSGGSGLNTNAKYTIVYNAASAGQTLTVQWLINSASNQSAAIFAATLS